MDVPVKEKTEWAEFLSVIIKHLRIIVLFVVLSSLAGLIVTFFIPKLYTSTAIIFPTESNSLEDAIRNPQFGYDVEADRLIQLLQSNEIRDSIAKKFDLLKYYDIDKNDLERDYKLKMKFEKDVTFYKTVFMSINISARTRDPKMSAGIANEIVSLLSAIRERLLKHNIHLAVNSLRKESISLRSDLDSLSGVVNRMIQRQKNIGQYVQTDRYISLVFDKNQLSDDATGKALQLVVNQYNTELNWFYDVQTRLKNANLMLMRPLPTVYVVEAAVPSYKKSYPRFSVNLALSFGCSLVFITFFLYFLEKIRKLSANQSGK